VEIDNFVFKPRELTVTAGTKVTWVNKDDVPHTATSSDNTPAFDSKALDTDDKYSFTFTKPGTYRYFCKVHPHMTAVVIVK
jgi:plastocyanin